MNPEIEPLKKEIARLAGIVENQTEVLDVAMSLLAEIQGSLAALVLASCHVISHSEKIPIERVAADMAASARVKVPQIRALIAQSLHERQKAKKTSSPDPS
jgi:hypothetical protein